MRLSTGRHNIDARVYEGWGRPFSIHLANSVQTGIGEGAPNSSSEIFWIADYARPGICRFDPQSQERQWILDGLWKGPHCIRAEAHGDLTVVDYQARKIFRLDKEGKLKATLGADNLLKGPATAQWHHDQLYIADYGSNRLIVLNKHGELMTALSHDFDRLHDLCFFENSAVIVDTWNRRLQRFSLDFNWLETIALDFVLPVSISRTDNLIAVSDVGTHRISLFDFQFRLLNTLGMENELKKPYEVHFSGESLFICDSDQGRILRVAEKDLII